MKTAYTEYRVVVHVPNHILPVAHSYLNEAPARQYAQYLREHGLSAHIQSRDVSIWRREDV